jgi:DNA-binding MarR family transcriptional regulator
MDEDGASTARQVVTALRRIVRAIDLHSRFLATRFGLTGPQLMVLEELSRRGDVSISDLARSVYLSHATVTDILARLERRGLVRRARSDADRRRVLASTTAAAEEILSRTPPPLQEQFLGQFNGFAAWERTQMLSSVQRIAAMMESEPLDVIDDLAAEMAADEALVAVERRPPTSTLKPEGSRE